MGAPQPPTNRGTVSGRRLASRGVTTRDPGGDKGRDLQSTNQRLSLRGRQALVRRALEWWQAGQVVACARSRGDHQERTAHLHRLLRVQYIPHDRLTT